MSDMLESNGKQPLPSTLCFVSLGITWFAWLVLSTLHVANDNKPKIRWLWFHSIQLRAQLVQSQENAVQLESQLQAQAGNAESLSSPLQKSAQDLPATKKDGGRRLIVSFLLGGVRRLQQLMETLFWPGKVRTAPSKFVCLNMLDHWFREWMRMPNRILFLVHLCSIPIFLDQQL